MAEDTTRTSNRKLNSGASEFNAISYMVEQQIKGSVNTAIPVRVESCTKPGPDGAAGYVSATPLVMQRGADGEDLPPVALPQLPFFRFYAGSAAVVVDPQPGDIGLAIFSQQDASNLKEGENEPVSAGSFRSYDMSDGFYIGGFLGMGAPTVYAELDQEKGINIKTPANSITIDLEGNITVDAPISVHVTTETATIEAAATTIQSPVTTVTGLLKVMGGIQTVSSNISVDGDISASGNFDAGGSVSGGSLATGGTLTAGGAATFGSTLMAEGKATLKDELAVTKAADFGSTLAASGAATFGSTLETTGKATFKDELGVDKAATFGSTLLASGAATFGSTLETTGKATFSDALDVTKSAAFGSTLTATGLATLSGGMSVAGNAVISGNITAEASGGTGGTITANGVVTDSLSSTGSAITANGDLVVSGDLEATDITATGMIYGTVDGAFGPDSSGDLRVTGQLIVGGGIDSGGDISATVSKLLVDSVYSNGAQITGDALITGDLTVDGTIHNTPPATP